MSPDVSLDAPLSTSVGASNGCARREDGATFGMAIGACLCLLSTLLLGAAFGCLERVSEMVLGGAIRGLKGYIIGGVVRELFLP